MHSNLTKQIYSIQMIDEKPKVPLSPPNSPRMSEAGAKPNDYQWQHPQTTSYILPSTAQQLPPPPQLLESAHSVAQTNLGQIRPPLRSHKSFPYSLGPSSRLQQEEGQDHAPSGALGEFAERVTSQGPQPVGSSNLPPATFGGSAPTSPAGRLTPNSPDDGPIDEHLDDEEIEFGTADQGEEEKPPMTAAELRAQKRKMKRFRLTHNQTRFLMSEFARQAHPDAAHRERLSREIPGLSPRQVQVWFQNRRAKLKRLTTDDRERMMRSRALPADFDMTQALHAPFGAPPPHQSMGTPMPSPGSYTSYGETSVIRPLTLDTLRRVPDYEPYNHNQYASPTGITPALGAFAFTPPQSATETMSPASVASGASAFSFQTQESPRRFPFGMPMGGHGGYGGQHPQMPRIHLQDRLGRPMLENAGSPLRTSMSYSGLGSSGMPQTHMQERSSSFSEHSSVMQNRPQQHRSLTGPTTSAPGPVGLGFTYAQMPQFTSSEQQHQQAAGPLTSHPGEHPYRRSSSHLAGPPINSFQQYQASQYHTPQVQQYPGFNGPYPSQNFQGGYQQQSPQAHAHGQQSFTPVPSQTHQFVPLGSSTERESEEGDNSEGGVSLPPY